MIRIFGTRTKYWRNERQKKAVHKLPREIAQTVCTAFIWRNSKKTNFYKSYKRREILESHDSQRPGGTWHIEEEVSIIVQLNLFNFELSSSLLCAWLYIYMSHLIIRNHVCVNHLFICRRQPQISRETLICTQRLRAYDTQQPAYVDDFSELPVLHRWKYIFAIEGLPHILQNIIRWKEMKGMC